MHYENPVPPAKSLLQQTVELLGQRPTNENICRSLPISQQLCRFITRPIRTINTIEIIRWPQFVSQQLCLPYAHTHIVRT
jgi:hypothetical protein